MKTGWMFGAVATFVIAVTTAISNADTKVHHYGVARYETTGWTLLQNTTHQPSGLTTATCLPSTGELKITFETPLVTVGTVSVTPDETYAGKVAMGASVGLDALYVTFRINGTTVSCVSTLLQQNNSNVFIDVWGHV